MITYFVQIYNIMSLKAGKCWNKKGIQIDLSAIVSCIYELSLFEIYKHRLYKNGIIVKPKLLKSNDQTNIDKYRANTYRISYYLPPKFIMIRQLFLEENVCKNVQYDQTDFLDAIIDLLSFSHSAQLFQESPYRVFDQ